MQDFGPPPTTEQILGYHRKKHGMKNHTNDCAVVNSGNCSCSLANQPNMDIVAVLDQKAQIEREAEHYVDVIKDLTKENGILQANFDALASYPWGLPWTYWFIGMITAPTAIIGWFVGEWMLH